MISTILNWRSPARFEITNKRIMVDRYCWSSSPLRTRSSSFWNCEQENLFRFCERICEQENLLHEEDQIIQLDFRFARWMITELHRYLGLILYILLFHCFCHFIWQFVEVFLGFLAKKCYIDVNWSYGSCFPSIRCSPVFFLVLNRIAWVVYE